MINQICKGVIHISADTKMVPLGPLPLVITKKKSYKVNPDTLYIKLRAIRYPATQIIQIIA